MSELHCVARLKIHAGKLDAFKRLAAQCAELVRTKDTGTLQYEVYFNSDNTACLVFERYRDSQALLEHHKNLGDTMAAILQPCSGSGAICGTPSPDLIEQLNDSPVQVDKPFQADEVTREDVVGIGRRIICLWNDVLPGQMTSPPLARAGNSRRMIHVVCARARMIRCTVRLLRYARPT